MKNIFIILFIFIFSVLLFSEEYYERRSCRVPLPTLSIYIFRIAVSGNPAKAGSVLNIYEKSEMKPVATIRLKYDGITDLFGISNVSKGAELIFYLNNKRLKSDEPIIYEPDMLTHDITLYYEKKDNDPPKIVEVFKDKDNVIIKFNEVIEFPDGYHFDDIIKCNKTVLDIKKTSNKKGIILKLNDTRGIVQLEFKKPVRDVFGNEYLNKEAIIVE